MTKILVDVDDTMLAEAMELLGTKTKKETINLALSEIVGRQRRLRALDDLRALAASGGLDLDALREPGWY
jgi:Arc/MetJ family transcription regulator